MYIGDLVTGEFSFNAPFRIIHYYGDPEHPDAGDIVFDSTETCDFPYDLAFKHISAINEGDDGVLEIEYADLVNEF